jgi:small subunit ribosomal protein S1
VVNTTDFGAFVSLGGIDGLVHRSELSWDEVDDPEQVLNVGDEIEVMVKDVDVDRERVSLSRKALMPSPWDEITELYSEGDLVEGIISNVVHFGAFVTLPDGIEGLIHSSEMDIVGPGTPDDLVKSGDRVLVRILSIEPDRHRMALSLKQVSYEEQMAWMEERRAKEEAELAEGIANESEASAQVDTPQEEIDQPEAAADGEEKVELREEEAPTEAVQTAPETDPSQEAQAED